VLFSELDAYKKLGEYYKRVVYISNKINKIDQPKQKRVKSFFFGYDALEKKHQIDSHYRDLTKASNSFLKVLKEFEITLRNSENIFSLNTRLKKPSQSIL